MFIRFKGIHKQTPGRTPHNGTAPCCCCWAGELSCLQKSAWQAFAFFLFLLLYLSVWFSCYNNYSACRMSHAVMHHHRPLAWYSMRRSTHYGAIEVLLLLLLLLSRQDKAALMRSISRHLTIAPYVSKVIRVTWSFLACAACDAGCPIDFSTCYK